LKKTTKKLLLLAGAILVAESLVRGFAEDADDPSAIVTNFESAHRVDQAALRPDRLDSHIDYSLDPAREKFFVHLPADFDSHATYGLLVYMHPGSTLAAMPAGWGAILDQRRLLFVAPLQAGNDQEPERRLGLAVLAGEEMLNHYRIDRKRVYVAGWSGGARVAGMLAFYQGDLFHGTIQSCGSNFYAPVPSVRGDRREGNGAFTYGLMDANADEVALAKEARFTLITGPGDFRHGDMLDIFAGGFEKFGFQAKLFDVPGMGHENAPAMTFQSALDYIDPGQ
jgi:hypothetical protein